MVSIQQSAIRPARRAESPAAADYWQSLLARLRCAEGEHGPPRVVGITSCAHGEGVSTVAAHLAAAAAAEAVELPVLLADANWLRPSVHQTFGVAPSPGLADVLAGRADLNAAIQPSQRPRLALLPAGEAAGVPPGVAAAPDAVSQILDQCKAQFDLTILDLPPASRAPLAIPLARLLDGVVLVVEAERAPWQAIHRTKEALAQSHVRILGVALNKRRNHIPDWLYRRL
jgi:capsular exopolysaccharide synthesis family protein